MILFLLKFCSFLSCLGPGLAAASQSQLPPNTILRRVLVLFKSTGGDTLPAVFATALPLLSPEFAPMETRGLPSLADMNTCRATLKALKVYSKLSCRSLWQRWKWHLAKPTDAERWELQPKAVCVIYRLMSVSEILIVVCIRLSTRLCNL